MSFLVLALCVVAIQAIPPYSHPWDESCRFKCGGKTDKCWCDDLCTWFGDCCVDYLAECKCTDIFEGVLCDYMWQYDGLCEEYGHEELSDGLTINEICCACGGGNIDGGAVIRRELQGFNDDGSSTEECIDHTFVDEHGTNCDWFSSTKSTKFDPCAAFGHLSIDPSTGLDANQACCACDGGVDNSGTVVDISEETFMARRALVSNTCAGKCGLMADSGCWCDDNCIGYGDCCQDAHTLCGVDFVGCTESCGKKSPNGCWCDDKCEKYDDCCTDYDSECKVVDQECEWSACSNNKKCIQTYVETSPAVNGGAACSSPAVGDTKHCQNPVMCQFDDDDEDDWDGGDRRR